MFSSRFNRILNCVCTGASLFVAACAPPASDPFDPDLEGEEIEMTTSALTVVDQLHPFAPNRLKIAGTSLCLGVPSESINAGTALAAMNCNMGTNQDFRLVAGSSSSNFQLRVVQTGYCLLPSGGKLIQTTCLNQPESYWSPLAGVNVTLKNRSTNQCIRRDSTGAIVIGACDSSADIWIPFVNDRGRATLQPNHAVSKCIDMKADLSNPLQQYDCHGRSNQRWMFFQDTNNKDQFMIASNFSGNTRCLDVPNGSLANGVAINHYECQWSANQRWFIEQTSPGLYQIRSVATGKCLDIPGGSTANSTALQQYDCHGGSNQQFAIRPPPRPAKEPEDPHHTQSLVLNTLIECGTNDMVGMPIDKSIGTTSGTMTMPSFEDRNCRDYGWIRGFAQHQTVRVVPTTLAPNIGSSVWDCDHSSLVYGIFARDQINGAWTGWKYVGGGSAFGLLVDGVCKYDTDAKNVPPGAGSNTLSFVAGSALREFRIATNAWSHNDANFGHPGDVCQGTSCNWPVRLSVTRQ